MTISETSKSEKCEKKQRLSVAEFDFFFFSSKYDHFNNFDFREKNIIVKTFLKLIFKSQ